MNTIERIKAAAQETPRGLYFMNLECTGLLTSELLRLAESHERLLAIARRIADHDKTETWAYNELLPVIEQAEKL